MNGGYGVEEVRLDGWCAGGLRSIGMTVEVKI